MSKKMQPMKFQSVEEFLDFLPEDQKLLVLLLREIVLECIPDCTEKLSYNVPYYSRNKRVCFIWPSAVPWGKVERNGVLFGFVRGNLIQDEINWLEKGTRKQVYTKTFFKVQEIEEEVLRAYIFEAVELDETLKNKKK